MVVGILVERLINCGWDKVVKGIVPDAVLSVENEVEAIIYVYKS